MVSEGSKHRDEPVASIRQGKDAGLVEDASSVGDGREQPVEVALVNTLRVEGDDSEKTPGVRSKLFEHRGGERQFDRSSQARIMLRLQHTSLMFFPFPDQSFVVPPVLMRNSGQQGNREGMEVEFPQNIVD